MSTLSLPPSRLRKQPKFGVIAVMTQLGYILSSGGDYAAIFYPRGSSRDAIKSRAVQPIIRLTPSQVELIEDAAQTEEDVLIACHSVSEKGTMPDPLQDRIEAAVRERTAAAEDRIRAMEAHLARLTAPPAPAPQVEAKIDEPTVEPPAVPEAAPAESAAEPERQKPKHDQHRRGK